MPCAIIIFANEYLYQNLYARSTKVITMKYTTFPFLIVVLCIFTSCNNKNQETGNKPAKPMVLNAEGFIVKPQPFQSDYTTSGSLLPNEEIQILPEVSGRVTS